MIPRQAYFKVAPLHRRLHIVSLASLTITLAFLILLSVSKISSFSGASLELAGADFGGDPPFQLVDGISGETVTEDLRVIHYGLWNYCWGVNNSSDISCIKPSLGYSHTLAKIGDPITVNVPSTWTRAFVLHPIAAVTAFFALLPTLHMRVAFKGYSVVLSTVSLAMVLATLVVDAAFVAITSKKFDAPIGWDSWMFFDFGFWLMIVPALFSVIAWVATALGHWKKRYVKVVEFEEHDFPMSPIAAANPQSTLDNGPWWRRFKWAGINTANTNHSQTTTVVGEQPMERHV